MPRRTALVESTMRNGLTAVNRNRYLFSGLIKCGKCGGGYSLVYRDKFGCSTRKNKGTCSNSVWISRQELETRVLSALRDNLMDPSCFEEFCTAFTEEINRARIDASADNSAKRAELESTECKIAKLIGAIEDGLYQPSMKERMEALENRKVELTCELENAKEPPTLLHPSMAQESRKRVDALFQTFEDKDMRFDASEDIRSLVGKIVVSPRNTPQVVLFLEGDLAAILTLAAGKRTLTRPEDERVLIALVAGAGFEPATFRL